MVSTRNCIHVEIDNYGFNGSPESSGDDSFISEYFDSSPPSDEDFLQQLSADLDIPLLLNPGEEEMSLLNSFLDKSPEEILSEITAPTDVGNTFCSSSTYNAEIKIEPLENVEEIFPVNETGKLKVEKLPIPDTFKNFGIKVSKGTSRRPTHNSPYIIPSSKTNSIIPAPVGVPNILPRSIINNCSANVVILDNLPVTNSSASISYVQTPTSPNTLPKTENVALNLVSLNCGQGIDARALKRQQRMIKNRESACLSRKRKRDYVTSLEMIVQQLTEENECLKKENKRLQEQLANSNKVPVFTLPTKRIAKALTVCAVFCVMGFNINHLPNPSQRTSISSLNGEQLLSRDHHGRSLLWAEDFSTYSNKDNYKSVNTSTNNSSLPVCPVPFNQSNNVRLVLELHRLIGKPYNISDDLIQKVRFGSHKATKTKKFARLRYRNTPLLPSSLYKRSKKISLSTPTRNQLQVVSPYNPSSYPEFFEAINRQDDTFYLVSLSSDHLLLPALNHNKTMRPKMSLLVPSIMQKFSHSQTSTISLMQIDCEVLDTHLVHVKYGSIPHHLRTHTNSTGKTNTEHAENVQEPANDSYKPYFMHKTPFKTPGDFGIIDQHK